MANCMKCGVKLSAGVEGAWCWNCHPYRERWEEIKLLEREGRLARRKAKANKDSRKAGL